MLKKLLKFCTLLYVLSVPVHAASLSDTAKEKRWVAQIEDAILDGEPVWLNDNGHEFFSIFTEPSENPRSQGLVIMHGMGVHPDWDQIIKPLRVELAGKGWHTLSIQMPVLANDATEEDYLPLLAEGGRRVQVALDYLGQQDVKPAAIIGHSLGVSMAATIRSGQSNPIPMVIIGTGDRATESIDFSVGKILDLYGSEDQKDTLENAPKRLQMGSANPDFTQKSVRGANHFFDNKNAELIAIVSTWLDSL